jgi:hypothetical protein
LFTFKSIYTKLAKLKDKTTEEIISSLDFYALSLIPIELNNLFIILMDIYTLTRMFREFKDIPNQNSTSPKYNIITVGNYHADEYIKILSILGFTTRIHLKSNNGCFVNVGKELSIIEDVFISTRRGTEEEDDDEDRFLEELRNRAKLIKSG